MSVDSLARFDDGRVIRRLKQRLVWIGHRAFHRSRPHNAHEKQERRRVADIDQIPFENGEQGIPDTESEQNALAECRPRFL